MHSLHELLDIITPHKRKQLAVIGYDTVREASQYDQLYDFLIKHPEASFEEAMALFYPPEKRKQFTNLLGKFRLRLVNALFLIDVKRTKFGAKNEGYFISWRNLCAIKIAARFSARNFSEELAKQTLKYATVSENFIVSAELNRILSELVRYRSEDDLAEEYFRKFVHFHDVHLKFSETKHAYTNILRAGIKSRALSKELANTAKEAVDSIGKTLKSYDYDSIWAFYYLAEYSYLACQKDFPAIVELMDKAIAHLENSKAVTSGTIGTFYHIKMVNLAAMGHYERIVEIAGIAESHLIGTSTLNWFVGQELLCLVLLHKGDYQQALEVYGRVKKNKYLKQIPPFKRENWTLLEAFLQLLKITGEIEEADKLKLPRFSHAKFVNQIIHNGKDKLGFNVTYQILQVLFLLSSKDYDRAEDKIMALYKYAQRHLKDDPDTERTYYFIGALTQIPRGGFLASESLSGPQGGIARRAQEWLEQMRAVSPLRSGAPFEVEVIPYEKIWSLATEMVGMPSGADRRVLAR